MDIRHYLFEKRMTSTALAKKIGIQRSYLSAITSGKTIPSRTMAMRIEAATEGAVTAAEIMFPKEEKR